MAHFVLRGSAIPTRVCQGGEPRFLHLSGAAHL